MFLKLVAPHLFSSFRWTLRRIDMAAVLSVLALVLSCALYAKAKTTDGPVVLYGYHVLSDYPHDHNAYTQASFGIIHVILYPSNIMVSLSPM